MPTEHEQFRPLIAEGGAVPTVEHGVLVGEVRGLEVCRVVTDQHTGAARLEVGIGQHDREAFQMLHGDVPPVEALAKVVATVAPHRRHGADPHPLNRLGQERALRARLIDDPGLIGASHVEAVPSPLARTEPEGPAAMCGRRCDRRPFERRWWSVPGSISISFRLPRMPASPPAIRRASSCRRVTPCRFRPTSSALLDDPMAIIPIG